MHMTSPHMHCSDHSILENMQAVFTNTVNTEFAKSLQHYLECTKPKLYHIPYMEVKGLHLQKVMVISVTCDDVASNTRSQPLNY